MINRKVAVEQRLLIQVAEQEIAVRDGRLGPTARIAYWAWISTGAHRADCSDPARSIHAMDPPPADTSARSMTGRRIG